MVASEQSSESYCLRQTHIPHTSRLFTDYIYNFPNVQKFYALNPYQPESFAAAAEAVRYPEDTRKRVAAALARQAEAFGAGDQTRRNLDRLRAGALAVVTGQQVGLYTGPMFSLYKALTAARLAAELTERGLDAVPVFWLATEDHDLHEVNHTFVLDGNYEAHRVVDEGAAHIEHAPVGDVSLSPAVSALNDRVVRLLEGLPHTPEVAAALEGSYRPSETYGSAFGRLLQRLTNSFGVILLEPRDPELRQLAWPVFRRAADSSAELGAALMQRDKELVSAGYHAQVRVTENSTLLFRIVDGQRVAIRRRNGEFLLNEERLTKDELLAQLDSRPQDFSANVLLRPVVQDSLLPTVAYVSGPAELAYFGQAAVVYERLLGRMPVIYPRASFTLLDHRAAALLKEYGLAVPDVFAGSEALRERMAQPLMPADLAEAFASDERRLKAMLDDLRGRMDQFDHTLADAAATSGRKMLYQLSKIRRKAARAAGRRSERLQQDAALLENLIYPHKNPQERVFSAVSFLARFPGLLETVYERIAVHCADHQVLVIPDEVPSSRFQVPG